jgi:hypothetical protein
MIFIVLYFFSLIFGGCQDALGDLLEEAKLENAENVTTSILDDGRYKSIVVTWKGAKNAAGYYVFRSTSRDDGYTQITNVTRPANTAVTPAVPTSYSDRPPSGHAYYYKVQAYSRIGSSTNNTSKLSEPSEPVNW